MAIVLSGRGHPRALDALIAFGISVIALLFFLRGIEAVPYHPDESAWLRMGKDAEIVTFKMNPAALAYRTAGSENDDILRLLNGPVTKYFIGLAWMARGYAPAEMPDDWNWEESWDANVAAWPKPGVLLAGRLGVTLVTAIGAGLIYLLGRNLGNRVTGVLAALFYIADPLILLHGRRAMAEGAMVTSLLAGLLAIGWLARRADRDRSRGWTWSRLAAAAAAGACVGIATAAKQTNVILVPAAALVLLLTSFAAGQVTPKRIAWYAADLAVLGGAAFVVFFAMNPVMWRSPFEVARLMVSTREALVNAQLAGIPAVGGQKDIGLDFGARVIKGINGAFLIPPRVWDVTKYLDHLRPLAEAYFADPLTQVARLQPLTSIMALLGVLGLVSSTGKALRRSGEAVALLTIVIWTVAFVVLVGIAIPIAWQRYFMGMLPPYWLFAAAGLDALVVQGIRGGRRVLIGARQPFRAG